MKRSSRILTFLMVICLAAALLAPCALAAGYTYKLTVFAGSQGSFGGRDRYEITGLHYGDQVTLSGLYSLLSINAGSKYYVKGVKISGHDELTNPSVSVTGDQMYVIAYGIAGDQVDYTVNYVDANGTTLAASQVFKGNVGDKPYVAYKYIDGYQPQAYNLAKTLSVNAADNVFTFIYAKVTTQVTVIDNGTTTGGGNGGNNGNNGNNAGGEGATAPGDLNEGVVITENNQENENAAGTQQLVDLDDMDVALSEGIDSGIEDGAAESLFGGLFSNLFGWAATLVGLIGGVFSNWPGWAVILVGLLGLGLLVFLIIFLFFRRKKDKDKEKAKKA